MRTTKRDLNVPRLAVAFMRTPAIKAIAEKLEQYVDHHGWCPAKEGGDVCDCGLWELWSEFAKENGDGRTVNLTFKLNEPVTPDIFAGRVVEACARYSTLKKGEGVVLPSDPTQKIITDGKLGREEADKLLNSIFGHSDDCPSRAGGECVYPCHMQPTDNRRK